jgi:hypothetical protein
MNIDWGKAALNMQNSGKPLRRLSKSIGRNGGYLSQIARGEIKEPKFSDGVALLNLHLDICGIEKQKELIK